MSLDAAADAIATGDLTAALAHAIAAWRVTRAKEIAELAQAISDAIAPTLPQLARGKRTEMQKEWLGIAKRRRVEDVPRLVKAVAETHFRSTDAKVRADQLAKFPADPRMAKLVVDQLLHPRFDASSSKPFWTAMFQLFEVHADPRAATLLERYVAKLPSILGPDRYGDPKKAMRSWLTTRAKATIETLGNIAKTTPLTAANRAKLDRCTRALAAHEEKARDLFDAVFAAPDDDGVRAVAGDVLQERGDPRGELIALQLTRTTGAAPRAALAREHELLESHRAQWLGPLADVLEPSLCEFERGFLSRAWLRAGARMGARARHDDAALAAMASSPWWSTVRSISGDFGSGLDAVSRSKHARSLQHLDTTLDVFDAKALPLRSLTVKTPDVESAGRDARGYLYRYDAADVTRMARSKTFPALRHLGLRGVAREREGDLAFLERLPWMARIEALTVFADHVSELPLAEWLERAARFRRLATLVVERSDAEYAIRLDRVGRSWAGRVWTNRSWFPNVMRALEPLTPSKLTLSILPASGPVHRKAAAALAKRGIDVGFEDAPTVWYSTSSGDLYLRT